MAFPFSRMHGLPSRHFRAKAELSEVFLGLIHGKLGDWIIRTESAMVRPIDHASHELLAVTVLLAPYLMAAKPICPGTPSISRSSASASERNFSVSSRRKPN